MTISNFKPALIVIDVQEDFCPPNGSLAVPDGRSIVPSINTLLDLPFVLKVATKDWHPQNHISFASNHPGQEPFVSFTTIKNPSNLSETYESLLWPVHCVQGTPGAEIIPELDASKFDKIVDKGQDSRVEMYSAFYTPLKQPRFGDSGLAGLLKEKGITDCYVVGLAADYCVRSTAEDAASEGFKTVIVEEATRPVSIKGWEKYKKELELKGIALVRMDGPEVRKVSG